jgi:Carboxypeptidase regulatory-like domain
MSFKDLKVLRYVGLLLAVTVFCSMLVYPLMKSEAAFDKAAGSQETETPKRFQPFSIADKAANKCGFFNQATEPTIKAPFAPAASLCINGALAPTDPTWLRPATQSTLPGFSGPCSATSAAIYDFYSFNLTGCAFPTEVTITLCGPAGCLPAANVDSVVYLYRNVPAGDPLTANGGLPAVFNPASPCTNVRAAQDSLNGGVSSSPNGATCNQTATSNCLPICTGFTAVSGMRRQLGSGRFTVVVSGSNTTDFGSYNLYVNAPAAGCAVALAPTAASATISGRVTRSDGNGVNRVDVTLTGGGLSQPMTVRTNGFGYYQFGEVPVGDNYIVTVSSKQYTFNPSSRAFTLENNISDADFVAEQ